MRREQLHVLVCGSGKAKAELIAQLGVGNDDTTRNKSRDNGSVASRRGYLITEFPDDTSGIIRKVDVAVLLADEYQPSHETFRNAVIASLMGARHVVLAVNNGQPR